MVSLRRLGTIFLHLEAEGLALCEPRGSAARSDAPNESGDAERDMIGDLAAAPPEAIESR